MIGLRFSLRRSGENVLFFEDLLNIWRVTELSFFYIYMKPNEDAGVRQAISHARFQRVWPT